MKASTKSTITTLSNPKVANFFRRRATIRGKKALRATYNFSNKPKKYTKSKIQSY